MKNKFYYSDGTISNSFKDGKILHRTDGPAEEWGEGSKYWRVNGKCHRIDGPAIEMSNGFRFWLINGKKHRIDGPAIEGSYQIRAWWIEGRELKTLPKDILINYVKRLGLDLTLLLIDDDEVVRNSIKYYQWDEKDFQ